MKKIVHLFIMMVSTVVFAQTVTVINMIPNALSNETNQDSEPHITINPNDPQEFVGSAFTPNPTGANATAPIYFSQDGGNTWQLNNIVPSGNGMTGDITVGLSRNNILYTGILSGGAGLQMQILRSNNYTTIPGTMTNLVTRNQVDQPYVEVKTPLGGALRNNDAVYVGNNDFNAASNQTASIEQSLNAATAAAPANFTTERLEVRNPFGQDGPPIRTSVHPNGTAYAIFYRRTASSGATRTADIVVVRDDNWGQGATSYDDLTDPGDGLAGSIVAAGVNFTFNAGISLMGQVRLGDRATIAVDPRDDQTVYISYIDRATATVNTNRLNVLRSTDGGVNWSAVLLTVNNVAVPQLAVNTLGQVGFLYQQLTGPAGNQQWVTHFRQSNDGGANWNDTILHQAPSNAPVATFAPYLGDYAGLIAFGKDFYGVFAGNNTPDLNNFPNGVTYQRNANFMTNNLRNATNTANVNVSIDPFFFSVTQIDADEDFYVRDWTDSPVLNDIGLEPSTDPVFYNTSDIWNRRTDNPSAFSGNDRPQNENAQLSIAGNNFMFARVHRKGTGSAETVNLHFLKSEFGTGSNYVNANVTADPTLNFAAGEQVKTMTSGYEWTLNATTSSHVCIAVEISTPNDPIVAPTLIGRAPGWPDTDLSVLYDNNKAQRNIGVHTASSFGGSGGDDSGTITYYATLHNASFETRNMELLVEFSNPETKAEIISPDTKDLRWISNNTVSALNMKPGENRWVGIKVRTRNLSQEKPSHINVTEMVNNIPVNGFTIAVRKGDATQVFNEVMYLQANSFYRIFKLYKNEIAGKKYKEILEFIKKGYSKDNYVDFIAKNSKIYKEINAQLIQMNGGRDVFGVQSSLGELQERIQQVDAEILMNYHSNYAQALDVFITFLDKKNGDVADIIQNIRWQQKIFSENRRLASSQDVQNLKKISDMYINQYTANKITEKEYGAYMEKILPILKNTVSRLGDDSVKRIIRTIESQLRNPQRLQKAHYELLAKLSN